MLTFQNIIYQIGANGPLFMVAFSLLLLKSYPKFFVLFLLGSVMNALVNYLLKGLIAQARPEDDKVELEKAYRKILDFNRFGMPSGHTQIAFFTTVFVYLATQDVRVLVSFFILSLVVVYQRIEYKHHFLSQTLVGALVGAFLGWATFQYGLKIQKGKLEAKKDDFYFGIGACV